MIAAYCRNMLCSGMQKDGQQLPGKKGINMPAEQFQLLHEAGSALSEALEARDESYELQLSGK